MSCNVIHDSPTNSIGNPLFLIDRTLICPDDRITQRTLKRATEGGIATTQIVEFLKSRSRQTPARVIAALERFAAGDTIRS